MFKNKFFSIALAVILIFTMQITASAHSGRTDSSGGHRCSAKSISKGLCTGYHYHNGGSSSSSSYSYSSSYTAPKPTYTKVPVYLNGIKQVYDQPAIVKDGYTLVPLRDLFESFGATVHWDAVTETVIAEKGETIIEITVGNYFAYVNDSSLYIDEPAQIINGKTMVPLRFVSESFGAIVNWDGSAVKITY